MLIEVFVGIAVFIFAVLAIVIIQTLYSLRDTLRRVDRASEEITTKLEYLEPTFRSLSNLGEIAERETDRVKINYLNRQNSVSTRNYKSDLADLLIAGINLGSKLYSRRKSNEPE